MWKNVGEGRFALFAGRRRVVIHTLPGRFGDRDVRWETGQDPDSVFVDGICYNGDAEAFDFSRPVNMLLAAGVEMLSVDEPFTTASPIVTGQGPDGIAVVWQVPDVPTLTVGD